MRCLECNQNNVPGSLFCEHCGADLTAGREDDAPVQAEAPPTKPCPECGHPNPEDFVVCESCGRRLKGLPEPYEDTKLETPPELETHPEPPAEEPAPPPTPATPPVPIPPPPREPTVVLDPSEAQARRIETGPAEPLPDPLEGRPQGQLATGPKVGKVKLVTEQGMVIGKQFLLNSEEMLVGREDPQAQFFPDIDLTGMDEGYVHRQHARLTFEGSFLFVTHLGGHNRTYVNNRPIADHLAHPLNIGDTVRFGKVMMRLVEA